MKVLIKGAGDLATGISWRLKRAGYRVWMTDLAVPTAVRRTVAFSRAVYEEEATVEGISARRASDMEEAEKFEKYGLIPLFVDESADIRKSWHPDVVIDAVMAKKNLGTSITDAPLVIGVGPGFIAGEDCHKVIETKRGHYLGRVIDRGEAIPNTGIPGNIGGYTTERIIRASGDGIFVPMADIGDYVKAGQIIAMAGDAPVKALISGIVRGILQKGVPVTEGMKAGDIDARCEKNHCFTISDKARAIGGGVLEAVCAWEHREG